MSATFVPTDADTILNEILSDFTIITGRTLLADQPEYLFCSALAYRIVLERQRQNATGNSQLLAFSTAPIIDYIVALVGVTRTPAQYAVCTLQFRLVDGHGSIVIPQGTRVISTDGQVIFATKNDVTVSPSELIVNVDAECQETGIKGNGYSSGTITQIQDVQAYLSSCTNIDTTAGGSDAETDNQLRDRAFKAPSRFSVAGPRDAYKFFAFSASPLVIDVAVVTHTEDDTVSFGEVDVYPLLANGAIADTALKNEIQAVLSDETIRPLTDLPIVKNPTKVIYDLTVNITKYTTAKNQDILNLLNPILITFGNEKMATLGLDIINSEIESRCRVDGVYDLEVIITPTGKSLTGDNLVILPNEFPFLNDFTLNITGTNNG